MTTLWLILAAISMLVYARIEWKIHHAITKGIMTQEKVQLSGSKTRLLLLSALLPFLAVTFLFFALLAYGDAPFQPVCWLSVSLTASGIVMAGMYARLRFVSFKKDEK